MAQADGTPFPQDVAPRQYPDLHDHLRTLEAAGQLVRVTRPINKDTELHPLVRWQFRGGLAEADRKAFLFENVVDAKGRKYDIPVAVGVMAANRKIYSLGIGLDDLSRIHQRWESAKNRPIPPVEIPSAAAPVHEVVLTGADLDQPGQGVDQLPVPISSPGWDNAPYVSAAHYITADPDTGVHNIGNYRAMIKGPRRVGMNVSIELGQGIYNHLLKYRERREPMPAVLCIGGPPCISYVSVQKLDMEQDELHVAGGLVGAPVRVVRAKTVPLWVPADAEICIEGFISTDWLEPEGPFGESHGHVNPKEYNNYMDVTAITRRCQPVLASIISQVTPSESGLIKKIAYEPLYLSHLHKIGIKDVARVTLHEPLTSLQKFTIVQFKKGAMDSDVWRALFACVSLRPAMSKVVVAIDEDIDPENPDAVWWAMGYRSVPHRDVQILRGTDVGHAPRHDARGSANDSAVLWDARLRGTFPPVSLPKREYMENARAIWEELGLPPLRPQMPWFGYSLGDWHPELDEEADLAVRGEYFKTGEKIAGQRVPLGKVWMNTSFYGEKQAE